MRWARGAWSGFFAERARRRDARSYTARSCIPCNNVACIREACCRLSVGSIVVRSAVGKPHKFITKTKPKRERSGVE